MKKRVSLSVGIVAYLVITFLGVYESWTGIEYVADAVNAFGAAGFFVLLLAVAFALLFRTSERGWTRWIVLGLAGIVVALAGASVYAVVHGHTASSRFANEVREISLPAAFEVDEAASAAIEPGSEQKEFAARVWRTDSGDCAAVRAAFRTWAPGTVREGGSCSFSSSEDGVESDISLDHGVVIVERWMRASSAFAF